MDVPREDNLDMGPVLCLIAILMKEFSMGSSGYIEIMHKGHSYTQVGHCFICEGWEYIEFVTFYIIRLSDIL